MRDQTRKVMKAELDKLNAEIDRHNAMMQSLQDQGVVIKGIRDDLKIERDAIKADLDAEPE